MSKYFFFYDESEHSRKLSYETINADNFKPDFVVAMIGFRTESLDNLKSQFMELEAKYKEFYCVKELKSEIIKEKKFRFGLKTLKKNDLNFINDIFTFISNNDIKIFISVQNKIEFIIDQLLKDYHNDVFLDADLFRYTVTKIINVYYPKNVINSIYSDAESFTNELKKFCNTLLEHNKNLEHKEEENNAIMQLLDILDKASKDLKINWEYNFAFSGFSNFIIEHNCDVEILYIDKEGIGNTLAAAKKSGFENSIEVDSNDNFGIRIADFVAGTISRFIINITKQTRYTSIDDAKNIKLLDEQWFNLSKDMFECYKTLKKAIVGTHISFYKYTNSLYTDHFLYFISLLNYIDKFDDFQSFIKDKTIYHSFELNNVALKNLYEKFDSMRSKLKLQPVNTGNIEFYINGKGAICYFDYNRHEYLLIKNGSTKYHVLSVGLFGKFEKACVTIRTESGPVLYLLPDQLLPWAFDMVALANAGMDLFPSDVIFTFVKGKYYVDLD